MIGHKLYSGSVPIGGSLKVRDDGERKGSSRGKTGCRPRQPPRGEPLVEAGKSGEAQVSQARDSGQAEDKQASRGRAHLPAEHKAPTHSKQCGDRQKDEDPSPEPGTQGLGGEEEAETARQRKYGPENNRRSRRAISGVPRKTVRIAEEKHTQQPWQAKGRADRSYEPETLRA